MPRRSSSFDQLPGIRWRMPRPGRRLLVAWRLLYRMRERWRRVRVSRTATKLLGVQYHRSRDMIEVDITYRCNLSCPNCNRSIGRAPSRESMSVSQIARFVDRSIEREKRWYRIRILGGEPTLHPRFRQVLDEFLRYKDWSPDCILELVTNGHGARVQGVLERIPDGVRIENSSKTGEIEPSFRPFSVAPIDDPRYGRADFSNGCAVMRDCGMGLTPGGYYPCAVAGGIDRVLGSGLGLQDLPADDDDMADACRNLCRLCGRFLDGHYLPRVLREELTEELISPTWKALYQAYGLRDRGDR
jgi:hypothetical protein